MTNKIKLQYFPSKTFINGEWADSFSGQTFQVLDPATGITLGQVPDCDAADVAKAVEVAQKAFLTWSNLTAEQRSKFLRKLADLHIEHKQQLAEIITYENGKPLKESLIEIDSSAKAYEWFGEEAKRSYGDLIPATTVNKRFLVIKQPVGVCAFITPWNFPAYMLARKAAAALAAGCTFICKPAEDTPFSALALAQLVDLAGLPAGCVNVVTSSRNHAASIGKAMCEQDLVRKLSFTGSTQVGKILISQSASTVTKLSLELGGNAPFIVFNSADVARAVNGLMAAKFRNTGQTCISANRVLVQSGVHDRFVAELEKTMRDQLHVGNGFDQKTTQGPLINQKGAEKVQRLVTDAVAKGARLQLGGELAHVSTGGHFYEPTLLLDINSSMQIFEEEIFGPVVAIFKFESEEEAVQVANSSQVGLAGYFYSQDLGQVWRVAEKLEVGMVGVNEGLLSTIEAPFGGIKQSGYGVEGSRYGIDEYINKKYVCIGI